MFMLLSQVNAIMSSSMCLLLATDSTQHMRWRRGGESHSWCEIQFILCDSRWRSETKALNEGGEEEEELHLSQTFSETHPATCKSSLHSFKSNHVCGSVHFIKVVIPAEKGMKASLLTNWPFLSRKCEGLKVCGLSHSLSSYRTEVRRGNTIVPCGKQKISHVDVHLQN